MNQISAHSSLRGAHRPLPEDRYREMVYQINDSGASGRVSADWNVGALTPSARIREDACEHVLAVIIHHPSSIIEGPQQPTPWMPTPAAPRQSPEDPPS